MSAKNSSETDPTAESVMADATDEQLLIQYRETGNERLFALLVHRYEKQLYSYLRRYLQNAEQAEDVFQATFMQLHLKCDQFQEGRRFRPWLYQIATNQAIDMQRKNKRHQILSLNGNRRNNEDGGQLMDLLVGNEPNPMAALSRSEQDGWVASHLAKMPEHLRLTVHLVYFQGLKFRDAAEVMSIPVGTVKSRIHSAIHRLADKWQETHDSEHEAN